MHQRCIRSSRRRSRACCTIRGFSPPQTATKPKGQHTQPHLTWHWPLAAALRQTGGLQQLVELPALPVESRMALSSRKRRPVQQPKMMQLQMCLAWSLQVERVEQQEEENLSEAR